MALKNPEFRKVPDNLELCYLVRIELNACFKWDCACVNTHNFQKTIPIQYLFIYPAQPLAYRQGTKRRIKSTCLQVNLPGHQNRKI